MRVDLEQRHSWSENPVKLDILNLEANRQTFDQLRLSQETSQHVRMWRSPWAKCIGPWETVSAMEQHAVPGSHSRVPNAVILLTSGHPEYPPFEPLQSANHID